MERYPEESLAYLLASLKDAEKETNPIRRYDLCVDLVNGCIKELEAYVRSNCFANKKEEIIYFREHAPHAYSRLFYYMKLRELEILRSYSSPEKFRGLLKLELRKIEDFTSRHADVCRGYYKKATSWDDYLFTPSSQAEWSGEEVGVHIDKDFTLGSYWVSWIMANEGLKTWLERTMIELDHTGATVNAPRRKLRFTGSKRSVVELGKAMHLAGCFNNGNITQKELFDSLAADWGIDLGDFNVTIQEIGNRKISRTKFLDELRAGLMENMDGSL